MTGPNSDTIVAVATPPGRGGIGVVRLSGPEAAAVAARLLDRPLPAPRLAALGHFCDAAGEVLDEVMVTWFPAPHSYTAEDVVEVAAHGSPVILEALVDRALALGARLAEPGEFTQRAFLNGRLDLSQAEAVRDLVDAQTLHQARLAARQLHGSVARMLAPVKQPLVELIARLEAGIDFADNDVATLPPAAVIAAIAPLEAGLADLMSGFAHARLARRGVRLAVVGRPNVGKSSLFNRLLGRERAIVTAEAGTTRDVIGESFEFEGLAVHLLDTAGVREGRQEAERMGIERAWQTAADADLVLLVADGSQPPQPEDGALLARLAPDSLRLLVLNKSDLPPALPAAAWWQRAGAAAEAPRVSVSARTGAGWEDLGAGLRSLLAPAGADGDWLGDLRHQEQVRAAHAALGRAACAAAGDLPHEAILVDLYAALAALGAITGQTAVEDILGVIFSTFCIGK